jgi:hypothetical protein
MTKTNQLQAPEAIKEIVTNIRTAELHCAKAGLSFSALLLRVAEESLSLNK